MANPPPSMAPTIDQVVLDRIRQHLAEHNWMSVYVPQDSTAYTIGLTAYQLPELVLVDVDEHATAQLDQWTARAVAGDLELGATVTVQDLDLREHTYPTRLYDPQTRGGLWLSRALYGPRMTALEIDVHACRCTICRAPSA